MAYIVYSADDPLKRVGILDGSGIFLIGDQTHIPASGWMVMINPALYGDDKENKICNICHRVKPSEEFQKNQNGKDNRQVRRPSCNECRLKIDGIGMESKERKRWESNKPHLEIFKCPICKKTTIPGLTSKVVLNHDHKTGKITGWICESCNTGLGRFKDDVGVLQSAIDYLNTHT